MVAVALALATLLFRLGVDVVVAARSRRDS
jgi:hypothetical protein